MTKWNHRNRIREKQTRSSNVFFLVADLNECALYPGICPSPSRCRNTIGGHECDCPRGFVSDKQKICVGELMTRLPDQDFIALRF